MATLVTGRMITDSSINTADIAAGAVGVSQLSAGAVAQSFGNTSGAFNFRNKIINGNFDIWQRGTSFSGVVIDSYTADRWQVTYTGSGGTRTISRQPFDLGQTSVLNEPTYYLSWNQSVAGTGATYNVLRQKIESVRTLANKEITVSFYAKANTALTAGVYAFQNFGTGGSANTFTNTTTINVTTSWQKFTVNLTIPSLATKSIGSSSDDSLILTFALPLNTIFTFDLAQVQLEEGSVATPFEQRPIGTELALCQRYYEVNLGPLIQGPGIGGATTAANWQFKVSKRVAPTCTGGTPVAAGNNVGINGAYVQATTASASWAIGSTASAEL